MDTLKNIKVILQYDGTGYSGWQIQKTGSTIQGLLEEALGAVTGEHARVSGAGRTDAGVHAFAQVAAFKTRSYLEPAVILRALNAHLPLDVRIIHAGECPEDFHPRYSARGKTYSYLISRRSAFSVFLKRYSWQLPGQVMIEDMREAAAHLIGRHDFSSFRASGCSAKNAVRDIRNIEITSSDTCAFLSFRLDAPILRIRIQANAFLRHMARNIVGTLADAGTGRTHPDNVKEILEARDRRSAGKTAPACGLFLEKIEY